MRQTIEEVKSNVKWLKNNEKPVETWLSDFIVNHKI
jgi:hypothetical protein